MKVVRLRRGWRVSCTDLEMELMREALRRGLEALNADDYAALPYKVRKVFRATRRWTLPEGPLAIDEDRRAA
jgi:hypothetical protein